MNNYILKFVANNVLRVVGVKRLANYVALSVGPRLIDQAVNVATRGYVPVQAVRVLRTTLSYAPIAVVMGTGGTGLVSTITYYVLIQISETVCMLVIREATSKTWQGVKYILKSTVNTISGSSGSLEGKKKEDLDEWVFMDKPGDIDVTPDQMKQVEDYIKNINLDELRMDQQTEPLIVEESIKKEMEEFVMIEK